MRRAIYYGWWVLAASAVTEMLSVGSTSYAAGLFVLPVEREFGIARAAANSALLITFAGAAAMAPVAGYLLDRVPAQRVIAFGGLTLALGFLAISATSSLALITAALFLPVAFGGMAIGPLTTSTLTARWFYRRRGRALGIATVATSGGGILVVPLLSLAIETLGWRVALALEGALIALIVAALSALVIRGGPAELGLERHWENEGRAVSDMHAPGRGGAKAANSPWGYGRILSAIHFWAVALVLSAITGIAQALVVTMVPYGLSLGFSPAAAAFLISAFSVSAAIVKLSSGFLAEVLDRRTIMLASTLAMSACLALLLSFSAFPVLLVASCLAGAALGCVLPASAALVAAFFGSPAFGRAMGLIYVGVVISSVVAAWFIGFVFDRTGGYGAAFAAFLGIASASAAAVFAIRASEEASEAQRA